MLGLLGLVVCMDSTRIRCLRSGKTKQPRGSIRIKMGSKEDERKLTEEDKFYKLELKIQDLTDTLVAFMKESVVKRNPKRSKESTKGEEEELKKDDEF
ncbi:hypothetical protein MKW92_047827, partial [Papaver armeniacum]